MNSRITELGIQLIQYARLMKGPQALMEFWAPVLDYVDASY